MRFTVTLPNDVSSIPLARRELEPLAGEVDELTLRNARLLVSELVTNAVRHVPAGEDDDIRLSVVEQDGHVRVEVCDGGPGFTPKPRTAEQDVASGWGLHLLAKLSARWGVDKDGRARVWFELPSVAPAT